MDTWTKRVTEIGLALMTEEARKERIDALIKDGVIDGAAIAALIDECKAAVGLLTDQEEIREALKKIDGKRVVAASDPDAIAQWILSLM